jgi:hypothetical protein
MATKSSNETTSSRVAKVASSQLKSKTTSAAAKTTAASALTQKVKGKK